MPRDARVPFVAWLSVDLDDIVYEVHDPVLRHATRRVERRLPAAIVLERGLGHLDEKERLARRLVEVVAYRDDGDVGLGLGVVRRGEGSLRLDLRAPVECKDEDFDEARDPIGMRAPDGAHAKNATVCELDPLVTKRAALGEPLVFDALERAQPPDRDGTLRNGHGGSVAHG